MARERELEAQIEEHLRGMPGLARKPMFGGLAWLQHGNLLCCARDSGMLVRLGKGNDAWALQEPGVTGMLSVGRPMAGWVHADPDACEDERLRARLLHRAKEFVAALPPKR